MRCFARWEEDEVSGLCFRDQTILQFGDSWNLLGNFVLLNPGSAVPLNGNDQTVFLKTKAMPFFIDPVGYEKYVGFSIDPLMRHIINLFKKTCQGGVIKLYNLFNLKNQNSNAALTQLAKHSDHVRIFTKDSDIKFCDAPVIIAAGANAANVPALKDELIRHVTMVPSGHLYKLARTGESEFSIVKAQPGNGGFVDSYHPSYTFKYGNTTYIGELT